MSVSQHIFLAGLLTVSTALSAQTSTAAGPLMAELSISASCGSGGFGNDRRPAAAIIFGFKSDTLFAVTANHAIRSRDPECLVRNVRVVTREPFSFLTAIIRPEFDTKLDLAIVAAVFQPDSVNWKNLRRAQGIRGDPSNLYLIGCPASGSCYDEPLQVRIRRKDSTFVSVQSAFLEEGYSGGPAVDGSGQLIGMTLDYGGQNARILRWSAIEKWLSANRYRANIPTKPIDALGHWLISIGTSSEARMTNPNGSKLAPSVRLLVESWDSSGSATLYGLERIARPIYLRCAECADHRTVIGTVGFFGSLGGGYAPRNKGFPLFGPSPISAAAQLSFLVGSAQQLVRRDDPDQVDPSTGTFGTELFLSDWSMVAGPRVEALFNASVTNSFGIRGSVGYTALYGLATTFGLQTTTYWDLGFGLSYRIP